MYLQSIHLTNIKSFRDATLELPSEGGYAGWNVILGGNAAGKTTLLQAIALCFLGAGRVERLVDGVHWPRAGSPKGSCTAEVCLTHADGWPSESSPQPVVPMSIQIS
ncbi:MAG: hypothetical protein RL071_546, partial [Pseudomonadota bacterium]